MSFFFSFFFDVCVCVCEKKKKNEENDERLSFTYKWPAKIPKRSCQGLPPRTMLIIRKAQGK